jgi:hypothetical protein
MAYELSGGFVALIPKGAPRAGQRGPEGRRDGDPVADHHVLAAQRIPQGGGVSGVDGGDGYPRVVEPAGGGARAGMGSNGMAGGDQRGQRRAARDSGAAQYEDPHDLSLPLGG